MGSGISRSREIGGIGRAFIGSDGKEYPDDELFMRQNMEEVDDDFFVRDLNYFVLDYFGNKRRKPIEDFPDLTEEQYKKVYDSLANQMENINKNRGGPHDRQALLPALRDIFERHGLDIATYNDKVAPGLFRKFLNDLYGVKVSKSEAKPMLDAMNFFVWESCTSLRRAMKSIMNDTEITDERTKRGIVHGLWLEKLAAILPRSIRPLYRGSSYSDTPKGGEYQQIKNLKPGDVMYFKSPVSFSTNVREAEIYAISGVEMGEKPYVVELRGKKRGVNVEAFIGEGVKEMVVSGQQAVRLVKKVNTVIEGQLAEKYIFEAVTDINPTFNERLQNAMHKNKIPYRSEGKRKKG